MTYVLVSVLLILSFMAFATCDLSRAGSLDEVLPAELTETFFVQCTKERMRLLTGILKKMPGIAGVRAELALGRAGIWHLTIRHKMYAGKPVLRNTAMVDALIRTA